MSSSKESEMKNGNPLPCSMAYEKKNSLIENSDVAKWFHDVFIATMDRFTNARSTYILILLTFFLGRNLGIFLWILLGVYLYIITYRAIRFWVNRWLMYFLEFCYFGNYLLIVFILFLGESQEVFYITFTCSTGVMALAVIIFNNQAEMGNTEYLTSAFIHSLPMTTVWALRWRHLIYTECNLSNLGFSIVEMRNVTFAFDTTLWKLILLPIAFWFCWAVPYFILNTTCLNKYVRSEKYPGGVGDWTRQTISCSEQSQSDSDPYRNCTLKFLFLHFSLFVLVLPLTVTCFYNFYLNCAYLSFLIIFLGWNTAKNHRINLEKEIMKFEKIN